MSRIFEVRNEKISSLFDYVMYFSGLNLEQRKIVETGDGVVIVNAGPGTGKTKTLISRVAYLILIKKILPENILTLTFTNRAGAEMRDRLQVLLEKKQLPFITTFHGFAYSILLALGKEIKLISEEEQKAVAKEIIRENRLKISARDFLAKVTRFKNQIDEKNKEIKKITDSYNKKLYGLALMDFDDLLLELFQLLKSDLVFRKKLKKQYKYILIDEFQDTNNLQYQIIRLILNKRPNLFVIGDPLQSIYSFRGASIEIFKKLKKDFSEAKEEALLINYRSLQNLVEISNCLFPNQINLVASQKHLGKVGLIKTLNEYSEADWIINFISEKVGGTNLLNSCQIKTPVCFSDFAVIYRTHYFSRTLQNKFKEEVLPYEIVKEDSVVEGDHIKLLSMHAAKGLEFKYVFICGFEENLIPYQRYSQKLEDLEEETRLLYVAMTRAKEELYLFYTQKREGKKTEISRYKKLLNHPGFLELEDEATEKILKNRERLKLKKSQLGLF